MTISRVRPIFSKRHPACSRLALVLTAGLAVGVVAPFAVAQETTTLRGSIRTADGPRPLPGTRPAKIAVEQPENDRRVSQYQPISEGALPDSETELDGLVPASDAPIPSAAVRNSSSSTRRPTKSSNDAQSDDIDTAQSTKRPLTAAQRRQEAADSESKAAKELTTGTVRSGSIDSIDEERNSAEQAAAERMAAIEALSRPQEETPYAATGIRVGSFILRPTLDQGIEWTSNAQSTASGNSDFLSETRLRLNADSQWSRHSASLALDGRYRTSITGTGFSEFSGNADATVGLDIGNELRINGAAGYQRRPEDATSPTVISGALSRPLRQTLTGSLGAEKYAGKLRTALTGKVSRDIFGDATLSTGGTLSQADRNNTLYTATLRGGYEISPALVPFVELEYGRRLYDQRLDASGFARSANRYGARGGVEFDMGDKLKGEVSAGWVRENIDDSRLAAISALSLNGNIAWSPMRGTIINAAAGTEIEGSTTAGSSGSVLYNASLSATRDLRANLTGTASVGTSWRRYASSTDRDTTINGEVSLTWWMNRYAGITGRARHERVTSNVAGRDSNATSVYLGLTLKR